jgi:hypothetical protein
MFSIACGAISEPIRRSQASDRGVERMSLARPGQSQGKEPRAKSVGQDSAIERTRQETPAKNPIRSRCGFEPFAADGRQPFLPAGVFQRLPMSLSLRFAARGGERPLSSAP